MKHRRTLTISLCLTLALAGVVVYLLKKPVPIKQRERVLSIAETMDSPGLASLPAAAGIAPTHVTWVTNRFAWSKVEVDDFAQLAMNLRAVGCPEKTVRDVLAGRGRRALDRLSRDIESKLATRSERTRRAHSLHEREQESAARAEMLASLERALGRDVFTEDGKFMENFVDQALLRFLSGPMPEETFSRFVALVVRHEKRRDAVRSQNQGSGENEETMKNLGRQFRLELASVLSPNELEEFNARSGMCNFMDDIRFDATDLSPAEIRQIALIRAQFQDPAKGEWFNDNSLTSQQEAQAAKAVLKFLGESRYSQVERAGNGDFKTLFDLGRDLNLPRAAAVAAFELRQFAAQEAAGFREDKSLSESERDERLAQLQAQAQEGVLKVLGAKACAQYLKQGGSWLTNIGGL